MFPPASESCQTVPGDRPLVVSPPRPQIFCPGSGHNAGSPNKPQYPNNSGAGRSRYRSPFATPLPPLFLTGGKMGQQAQWRARWQNPSVPICYLFFGFPFSIFFLFFFIFDYFYFSFFFFFAFFFCLFFFGAWAPNSLTPARGQKNNAGKITHQPPTPKAVFVF